MSDYSSILPLKCRKTSVFGKRWGILHAGTDYAPPKAGQKDVPVFAVRNGVVAKVGRGSGLKSAAVLPYHSGNAVLINHGVIGGDVVETYYGHLASYNVKAGQRVVKGQKIGVMGNTGNSTGIHLHFAVRLNRKLMIDPDRWIRSKGIVVGTTEPVKYAPPINVAPIGNISTLMSSRQVQTALKKMGYYKGVIDGVNGTMQKNAVKAYQSGQKAYKLVADGNWGARTQAHYHWVVKLQNALNKPVWRGKNAAIAADGDLGDRTVTRIKYVQKNFRKAYKGAIDGLPGKMFCKALAIPAHP